jgi:HEAT repeat protein
MQRVPQTKRVIGALLGELALACASLLLLGAMADLSRAQTSDPRQSLQAQLIARLSTGDEESRIDAATRLANLFRLASGAMPEPVVAALGQALENDPSPIVRALAARAFETTREARALPALLAALKRERETAVRKAIIYALAHQSSPQVTSALLPQVKDKRAEIRATALYALAEIADPASANAFIEVLQKRRSDEDAFARSEAARGLGRIGERSAIAQLVATLREDKAPEARREAAIALGRIGNSQDTAIIEALRAASLAADPYLSREAAAALAQINARS